MYASHISIEQRNNKLTDYRINYDKVSNGRCDCLCQAVSLYKMCDSLIVVFRKNVSAWKTDCTSIAVVYYV